ncbi:hypothetical protein TNCV_5063771 [Trichonephila clavipes]|nr:hypothetical protein TNCV_5063771 [Trichonephila clavipes]
MQSIIHSLDTETPGPSRNSFEEIGGQLRCREAAVIHRDVILDPYAIPYLATKGPDAKFRDYKRKSTKILRWQRMRGM